MKNASLRKKEFPVTLLLAVMAFCITGNNIYASAERTEDIPPLDVKDMDPDFAPRLGTYTYNFYWLFKTGAKSQIQIAREGDEYRMITTARTGKLIDLIYKVRYKAEAILNAGSMTPMKIEVNETVRSTSKQTKIEYADGNMYATRVRSKKSLPEPSVRETKIDAKNGRIMDYFSAILVARAVKWEKGLKRFIEVFDGRGLNNVTLECTGLEQINVKKKKISAWHIKVRVIQLGDVDEDDELIAENINLYLSSDESREIVHIEADTPYGDMKVKLDAFEDIETPPDRQYSALETL